MLIYLVMVRDRQEPSYQYMSNSFPTLRGAQEHMQTALPSDISEHADVFIESVELKSVIRKNT